MREWEQATWTAGVSEESVMRRAGAAVAAIARKLTQPGAEVLVLTGKGHNGDDARFAVEGLSGRRVQVINVTDPAAVVAAVAGFSGALIVDGLFGIGLSRPLAGDWLRLVAALNQSRVPILAVDVPSGLDADTGKPLGDAVRATMTVTFGAMKQGLLRTEAAPFTGRLEVATDIGLVPCPFATALNWTLPEDFAGFPHRDRRTDTREPSATSQSSPEAWVTTVRPCWRREGPAGDARTGQRVHDRRGLPCGRRSIGSSNGASPDRRPGNAEIVLGHRDRAGASWP